MNVASKTGAMRAPLLITSIALLVLAFGYLLRSMPSAQALPEGPQVTGGSHPYLTFSGTTSLGSNPIYTVPNDRIFVVTGACASNNQTSLHEDATLKARGSSNVMFCQSTGTPGGFLAQGTAHIAFNPGTAVVLESTSSAAYVVQGYLAHP